MVNITFINHAQYSFLMGKIQCLLTHGMMETYLIMGGDYYTVMKRTYINKVLDKTTYIWISHEHPDHFSIKFFNDYKEKIFKNKITLLFQKTKRQKSCKFPKYKKGLK